MLPSSTVRVPPLSTVMVPEMGMLVPLGRISSAPLGTVRYLLKSVFRLSGRVTVPYTVLLMMAFQLSSLSAPLMFPVITALPLMLMELPASPVMLPVPA